MAKYQCPDCAYIYDEAAGHPHEGFKPGTPWVQVPENWSCPDCAVRDKVDFVLVGETSLPAGAATQAVPQSAASECSTVPREGSTAVLERIVPSSLSAGAREMGSAPQQESPRAPVGEDRPSPLALSAGLIFQKWICVTCGHIYDEAEGDEHEGFAPGTRFNEIPANWCCPDCGATKEAYVLYEGE